MCSSICSPLFPRLFQYQQKKFRPSSMSFLVATVRRRKQNSILRATDTSCLRFESTRQNIDECIDISAKKKAYIDRGHLEISMYSLLYVRDILNLFDSYDLVTTTSFVTFAFVYSERPCAKRNADLSFDSSFFCFVCYWDS